MALNVGVALTSVPCDQAQEIQIISTCKAANYYTAASLSKLSYCGWLVVVGSKKKEPTMYKMTEVSDSIMLHFTSIKLEAVVTKKGLKGGKILK